MSLKIPLVYRWVNYFQLWHLLSFNDTMQLMKTWGHTIYWWQGHIATSPVFTDLLRTRLILCTCWHCPWCTSSDLIISRMQQLYQRWDATILPELCHQCKQKEGKHTAHVCVESFCTSKMYIPVFWSQHPCSRQPQLVPLCSAQCYHCRQQQTPYHYLINLTIS